MKKSRLGQNQIESSLKKFRLQKTTNQFKPGSNYKVRKCRGAIYWFAREQHRQMQIHSKHLHLAVLFTRKPIGGAPAFPNLLVTTWKITVVQKSEIQAQEVLRHKTEGNSRDLMFLKVPLITTMSFLKVLCRRRHFWARHLKTPNRKK